MGWALRFRIKPLGSSLCEEWLQRWWWNCYIETEKSFLKNVVQAIVWGDVQQSRWEMTLKVFISFWEVSSALDVWTSPKDQPLSFCFGLLISVNQLKMVQGKATTSCCSSTLCGLDKTGDFTFTAEQNTWSSLAEPAIEASAEACMCSCPADQSWERKSLLCQSDCS